MLFDVRAMRAVKEIIVAGHEPRSLQDWGWPAGDPDELRSDLHFVARVGPHLVLVFRDLRSGPSPSRSGLVRISLADLLARVN